MTVSPMTLNEIRERGFAALARELGPEGYVLFLQQFVVGSGDFTAERQETTGRMTLPEVRAALDAQASSKRKG